MADLPLLNRELHCKSVYTRKFTDPVENILHNVVHNWAHLKMGAVTAAAL